jgi:transcriptional regulator with XRE-family HTH domain
LFPTEVGVLDELAEGIVTSIRPTARLAIAVLARVAEDLVPGHLTAGEAPPSAMRQAAIIRGAEGALNGWCESFGLGAGMLAATVAAMREISGCEPGVVAPSGISALGAGDRSLEWRVAVLDAIRGRLEPLERIRTALELSETELGSLFGVSRQAVSQWREKGIPATRAEAVAHILQTVDLLDRKLASGRLPLVARRPADRLGGRSILQALAADPQGTHEIFAAAFDWSSSA